MLKRHQKSLYDTSYDLSISLDGFVFSNNQLYCHLRNFRLSLGITSRQLSLYSGVNEKYLSRYETLNILPNLEIAKILIDSLNELSVFLNLNLPFIFLTDFISTATELENSTSLFNKDVFFALRENKSYYVLKNFKNYRNILGLTQDQFGQACFKSHNTIGSLEKEHTSIPTFKTMFYFIETIEFLSTRMSHGSKIIFLSFDDLIIFEESRDF